MKQYGRRATRLVVGHDGVAVTGGTIVVDFRLLEDSHFVKESFEKTFGVTRPILAARTDELSVSARL